MQFLLTLFIYLVAASVLVGTPVAAYNIFLADMANYKRHGQMAAPVPPKIQAFLDRKAVPVPVQEPPPAPSVAVVPVSPPIRAEFVANDEPTPRFKRETRQRTKKQTTPTDASSQAKQPQPGAQQADPAPPRDLRLMTRMDRAGD